MRRLRGRRSQLGAVHRTSGRYRAPRELALQLSQIDTGQPGFRPTGQGLVTALDVHSDESPNTRSTKTNDILIIIIEQVFDTPIDTNPVCRLLRSRKIHQRIAVQLYPLASGSGRKKGVVLIAGIRQVQINVPA